MIIINYKNHHKNFFMNHKTIINVVNDYAIIV